MQCECGEKLDYAITPFFTTEKRVCPKCKRVHYLTASYDGAVAWNTLERHQRSMVAEPVIFQLPHGYNDGGCKYDKSPTLTANGNWQDNNRIIEPVCVQEQVFGRQANDNGDYDRRYEARTDGKSGSLTRNNRQNAIAEPVRIGDIGSKSQGNRIYSIDGKSVCINSGGGGLGAKTGLYAIPTDKPVYEVRDGLITIKDKQYPIKLKDGFYIIRKLTVKECCRLQTLPDDYCRAVSASQAYKGLGNGWTAEVIIHILSHALKDIPRDEKILVLSMYDGIGTGRYCLDKMGFTNVEYHAYEIDKYAMQIAMSNYPDIIQHGDAFQVREDDWGL